MTTFLEFLSAAADFALTLNLKAAIVATGFIVMLMLTRRRGAEGKGPRISQDARASRVRVGATGGSTSSFNRTQPNKSPSGVPVPRTGGACSERSENGNTA